MRNKKAVGQLATEMVFNLLSQIWDIWEFEAYLQLFGIAYCLIFFIISSPHFAQLFHKTSMQKVKANHATPPNFNIMTQCLQLTSAHLEAAGPNKNGANNGVPCTAVQPLAW